MNFKLVFFALLLVMIPSVFAANGITLSSPAYSLSLDSGTALNAVYGISNGSSQRVCFNASAESSEDLLETTVASPSFCLNPNERTEITVTAIASNETPSGNFVVHLSVSHDFGSEQHNLPVSVNQSPQISFSPSGETDFCSNESISIPVTIQNNSSSSQSVSIEANAPSFLPSVDKDHFSLDAGQSKTVHVQLHANSKTPVGTYEYTLTSRTSNQISAQAFSFHIRKCDLPPVIQTAFNLSVPTNCMNIAPGKTRFSSFSIENTGTTPVTIWVSINENNLDANFEDEGEFPITLEPEQGASSSVRIQVPEGIKEGLQYVSVTASSLNDSQTQNICVFAAKPFSLELFPNNVSVLQGDSFGVALTIENKWSESQTVSLSGIDLDSDTHVSFSQTSVHLNKYERKTVIATVRTDSDSSLGEHGLRFKANTVNGTKTQLLYFLVQSKFVPPIPPEQMEGTLDIVSYPTNLDLNAGESRPIAFTIANDSNETVSNVQVKLEGLPENVAFVAPGVFELAPLEARSLRGTIVVGSDIPSGTYSVRLVASNAFFRSTRTIRLTIIGTGAIQPQRNPLENLVTGLLVFGSNNWLIGLIVLALVIAWLVQSKTRFWSGLLFIIILLVILAVWIQVGWNPLWFVLLVFFLGIAGIAVSWSKDHDAYNRHKEKWKQVARSQ